MKPVILISASLLTGLCAGALLNREDVAPQTLRRVGTFSPGKPPDAGPAGESTGVAAAEDASEPVLPGASDDAAFGGQPAEKQRDLLLKLGSRLAKGGTCSDQLLIARLVDGLKFEEVSSLLSGISQAQGAAPDAARPVRAVLAEKLAALDPAKALEIGRNTGDPKVAQSALLAMAQKNGAEALRALVQLPEKLRNGVAGEMRSGLLDGIGRAGGSLSDLAAVLKENPQLLDPKSSTDSAVRRIVGQVASQAAAADPAAAMSQLRQMAAGLVQAKPGEDSRAAESALVARFASQMTRALRADAPAAARVVFNALDDSERNNTMVALEAAARFRESGSDAAIQFAEKQTNAQFSQDAARGVWWSLAQRDRGTALKWIESLPAGPFRDGALSSVMQESSFRNRTWGDVQDAVKAGTELVSPRSRLDYFAILAEQRRKSGGGQGEFISGLPISDADKMELRRRLAPIKSQ
jgi:hypothetical protein